MKNFINCLQLLILLPLMAGAVSCSDKLEKKSPTGGEKARPPLILSGSIELAPGILPSEDPLAVIFVMARTSEGRIGAVKKLLPPFQFPLAFELDAEDLMIPGMELKGKLQPSARLDSDGNANPPQSGDILGQAEPATANTGDRGIKIILSERVK